MNGRAWPGHAFDSRFNRESLLSGRRGMEMSSNRKVEESSKLATSTETGIDRRDFLAKSLGAAAGFGVIGSIATRPAEARPAAPDNRSGSRADDALQMRIDMAQLAYGRFHPPHVSNGEEDVYPTRIANYSKALPHNGFGEVDSAAYDALLLAVQSGSKSAFNAIPLAGIRPLTNPQAGLAFDLEGPDGQAVTVPPAPLLDSAQRAGEAIELYWMALLRDVPFIDYPSSGWARAASDELSNLSDFRGPKSGGNVTPGTLFRGSAPGDLVGPYLSQFLWKDVPYGSLTIVQKNRTTQPGRNYMTSSGSWLAVQNGALPTSDAFDSVPRYLRNVRDLGQYVHVDALYEAYLNAALILLGMNAPLDPGNPYVGSPNQAGFGTFGGPAILSLVTEVATRALKAVWYQKWFVHRNLRPEEFCGRVHFTKTGERSYPLHQEVLDSEAVQLVRSRTRNHFLPMAFPEGCPTHPSYGAGHATVAGACVTILKAWFDENWVMPNPVIPNRAGTGLQPYFGPGANSLTVGGELNKVAANIAIGRNGAGVHWRSDYWESVQLGETIAIGILEECKATFNEPHSFRLTKFDGTLILL